MTIKTNLHPLNLHNKRYDFPALIEAHPDLKQYLVITHNQHTIDFGDANAVKSLNCALLKKYYRIDYWDIPKNFLCPPIPGRVDYIHYLAQLLEENCIAGKMSAAKVQVLDIGTGASCIYPILGQRVYNWRFVASDIDAVSVASSKQIISANKGLSSKIKVLLQPDSNAFFTNIIQPGQHFELTICNPPFHRSLQEALAGNARKRENLQKKPRQKAHPENPGKSDVATLNFGGQKAELYCRGGELNFIKNMITESKNFREQVLFFSTLVSKKEHLSEIKLALKKAKVEEFQVIKMSQGQKISRFITWSFLNKSRQQTWYKQRLLPEALQE
ncbi:23S rRNA (adenine(1618)-N(6))-methyltransferase ['Osedax' symbiont bacterium Rs2_46_30_T18]|nr:23S rRNA (adenine(1618)-N(6))-methyltransferase ['Osedax' symbiont bacterium Rs2_46_30_T18]